MVAVVNSISSVFSAFVVQKNSIQPPDQSFSAVSSSHTSWSGGPEAPAVSENLMNKEPGTCRASIILLSSRRQDCDTSLTSSIPTDY
jgi:hypothetical protein